MDVIRRGRPKWAVAYIRVSTHKQAEEGHGLDHQRERIHVYALEHGYRLKQTFKDIASGKDRGPMMDRPGFSEAVLEAKRLHGTIIVAQLNRISRDEKRFLEFCRLHKVRIVSTIPGETETYRKMVKTISKGEQVQRNIASGTKRSLATKKAQGTALGNPATVLKANQASAKSRSYASRMKVHEVREYLRRHQELLDKTYAEQADALNADGIFSGWGRPWTKDSLRRQLRSTRQELELFEAPDDGS